jgi:hypothetical protein
MALTKVGCYNLKNEKKNNYKSNAIVVGYAKYIFRKISSIIITCKI